MPLLTCRLPVLITFKGRYGTETRTSICGVCAFAGQMRKSPFSFSSIGDTSPLLWLARRYAILDGPTMPIVAEGDEEPNNTYVEQLTASARAAVQVAFLPLCLHCLLQLLTRLSVSDQSASCILQIVTTHALIVLSSPQCRLPLPRGSHTHIASLSMAWSVQIVSDQLLCHNARNQA